MNARIGGRVDLHALGLLSRPELEHRPADPAVLAREARALASQGLTAKDVAQALRLAPAAVAELLRTGGTGAPEPNATARSAPPT